LVSIPRLNPIKSIVYTYFAASSPPPHPLFFVVLKLGSHYDAFPP